MGEPPRRRATYEDLLAAPPHAIAQLVDGVLHVQPRLGAWFGAAKARIPPFDAIELELEPLWVKKAEG